MSYTGPENQVAEDPKKAEGHAWVKSVLNMDVAAMRKDAPQSGGHRAAKSGHDDADAPKAAPDTKRRDAFYKDYAPLAAQLQASMKRTAKLKDVVAEVRVAENMALDEQKAAQAAADKDNWSGAEGHLKKLTVAMKTLGDTYTSAANELDGRIGRRLTKLERLVEQLEGTKLDASEAKKARDEVSLAEAKANQNPAGDVRLVALYGALAVADKAAIDGVGALKVKGNQGAITGMEAFRKSVSDSIKTVGDDKVKADLNAKLVAWDKEYETAIHEADPNKQKTLLAAAEKHIRKLITEAGKAGGGDVDGKQQAAFQEALQKRFGLKIKVPPGMTSTHFDQVYDMMAMVPVEHASQDALQKLVYSAKADDAASGAFYTGKAKIEMGDFGDGTSKDAGYRNPVTGKSEPLNAFNVTTLHEIGHSVDDKYKIMKTPTGDGLGGWTDGLSVDAVVKVFSDDFFGGAGKGITADKATVDGLIKTALTKGPVKNPGDKAASVKKMDKPGTVAPEDWQKLKPMLDKCTSIRSDKWPWGRGKEVAFNGRAYHESYDGEWVSYSVAARKKCEVHEYQFRSPGEWFAELYAYTWYSKKKPPSAVDKKAAKYLYGGDA